MGGILSGFVLACAAGFAGAFAGFFGGVFGVALSGLDAEVAPEGFEGGIEVCFAPSFSAVFKSGAFNGDFAFA